MPWSMGWTRSEDASDGVFAAMARPIPMLQHEQAAAELAKGHDCEQCNNRPQRTTDY